jgi:2-dehydropantoate 2-reductase
MLLDLEAGRKTEIEYLSGRVVERARAARVPAPVHGAILSLVGEVSSGRHHPGEIAVRELKRRVMEEKGMSLL